MARQVNGFVGNFTSLTELNNKYPPAEHAGCSANFISNGTTVKYWSNGTAWGGGDPVALQALVSGDGIIYGASKIRKMLSAIGQAAYRRVNLGYDGHSIVVGVDATSAGSYNATTFTDWHTKSQAAIIAKSLSAAYAGTAGSASIMMGGTGGAMNPLLTAGGGASNASADGFFGPGSWRAVLSAAAHTFSFTAVGASVRVYAVASGAASTVQARWSAPSVSAGATQTAALPSASPNPGNTPAGDRTWYEFTISPVVPGETVTLIGPTTGSYSVYFIDADYKPSTAGVTVHRLAQSGIALAALHGAALDSTDSAGQISPWIGGSASAINYRLGQAQSMSVRIPQDGKLLQIDVNDLNDWTNYGYTLADLKRHMSNYLSYHAGLGLPVLVVCGPIRDPAYLPGTRPYDQAALIAAYRDACAASTNGGFLDLTAEFTGATITDRYNAQVAAGIMQDVTHPNQTGHGYFGQRIAQALLTASQRVS